MPFEPGVSNIGAGPPHDEELRRIRHLASFPEKNPNPVFELDMSGRLTFSNTAADRLAGEAGAKDAAALLAADFPAIMAELESAGGKAVGRELLVKGQTYMASYNLVADPPRVRAYLRDITRQKRAEEELRASGKDLDLHNRIAEVFLTVPDDDMYTEVLDIVLAAFDSRLGVFGYIDEKGALVVPSMTRHAWDRCQVAQKTHTFPRANWSASSWPTAIREKRPVWSNAPSVNVPAGHLPIQRHISMPMIHKGEVIGLLQVANRNTGYTEEDVRALRSIADHIAPVLHARLERDRRETERKRAEEKLHLKSLILDQSIAAIATADINGTVDYVNPAFLELWGFEGREKAIGHSIASFFLKPEQAGPALDALTKNGCWEGEFLSIKQDGTIFINRCFASKIIDATGNFAGYQSTCIDVTALRKAEKGIKRIYETANDLICILGFDGIFKQLNPAWERGLGYLEADLLSKPFIEFVHPDDRPDTLAEFESLGRGNRTFRFENRYLKKDGSVAWLSWSAIADVDEQLIYGSARDITERKQAEKEARESTAKLQVTFEEAPIGISMVGMNKRFMKCNKAFCEFLGYSEKELTQKTIADVTFPEDVNIGMADLQAIVKGEKRTSNVQKRYLRKDGAVVWGEVNINLVRDWEGRPQYWFPVILDITERKRAEEALRLKNFVFDVSISANSIANIDGAIIEANNAFLRMWGFSGKEEVVGKPLLDFIQNKEEAVAIITALNSTGAWEGDYTAKRKDGSTFIAHGMATVVKDEAGKVFGYQSAVNDITDRKLAEEALRHGEQKFSTAFQIAPYAITITHAKDGKFVDVNDAFTSMSGFTREEALADSSIGLKLWVDEKDRLNVVAALRAGRPVVGHEYQFNAKDGKVITGLFSAQMVHLSQGVCILSSINDITDRKRSEAALQESVAKFRDTVKNLDEGYYSCSIDGLILDYNLAFCRILGIDPAKDMKGQKLPDFWQDPQDRKPYLKELMENGSIRNYLINAKKMNDEMIVVLASSHIVRDEKDKPQRIDGTFTDFTEKKRMQDALGESEAKYRGLFENAQIGMYRSSLDGSAFLAVNNKFAEMMGFEREQLLGTPGRIRLADPDERGRVLSLLRERGGTLVNYETRVLTKDGDALDVVASIELHREAGYLEGTMADISERKRAERTLRASEAKYRTLMENIPQKIFMKDTNFRWVSINERFAHDLGIRPDEAVGKLDIDLFPKDLADKYRADDERILRTGTTEDIEEKYLQDGKEAWVHTIKTPVKDDDGKTVGVLGIFWDITERKKADAELARYRDQLEDLVRQRTIELEAMNRELESFSYSVSHDLRAPLRTIDGFSLALMEDYSGKVDETGMDHLRRVRAATLRMAQLIDDLLKLSRVSRGELRIERADLGALARSVERELEKSEPKRKVDLVLGTDLVADGDARLLRLVMENLLSNAWKFTGKHPKATVTVGKLEKDGEAIFFVGDDGAGFDMAYVGKLFGPFQRLHSLEEFPGSGIGLATVQRIVHRHGGRIWAEGAVEKGATFWFTLNPKDNVLTKKETDVTARETDATRRETDATRRETDATRRETDATRRETGAVKNEKETALRKKDLSKKKMDAGDGK